MDLCEIDYQNLVKGILDGSVAQSSIPKSMVSKVISPFNYT
jgi:hypothetical protein